MDIYQILTILGIPAIISIIFQSIKTFVYKKHKQHTTEDDAIKRGIQALLRDRLCQDYKTYKNRGWVSLTDKDNYDNMYRRYHALGKNGVMDALYEEVMNLPTEKKTHPKK